VQKVALQSRTKAFLNGNKDLSLFARSRSQLRLITDFIADRSGFPLFSALLFKARRFIGSLKDFN